MVGQSLAGACHVTQVEAFGNMIGPEGGHAFAKALETNTCIQEVTLGSQKKPASISLKSLRENSVSTLDYSGKELLSEGGIVLAFMLRSNTSVTKVSGRFCTFVHLQLRHGPFVRLMPCVSAGKVSLC